LDKGRIPLIIFVHIPKTAGRSMNKVLRRQYGQEACYSVGWGPDMPDGPSRHLGVYVGAKLQPGDVWYPEGLRSSARRFRALPKDERERIRVILWHMSFGLGKHLPLPSTYITLLRKPVERVLSQYYYTAAPDETPGDADLHVHLSDRLEPNLQTRMLAGPYADHMDQLPPTEELLEQAKRNLRSCAMVGLAERFDETLLLLRKAFGWKMPFYRRVNVNRSRPHTDQIAPETLARISADNAIDEELYRFACALFEQQVEAYGPSFRRDLRLFRILNGVWQRWQHPKRRVSAALIRCIRQAWAPVDPLYRILSRWGGLGRILPDRLRPRVVASRGPRSERLRLFMGHRMIGAYEPQAGRWVIRRPYHLIVKESDLPS